MKVRLVRPHVPGCTAVRLTAAGEWSNPWHMTGQTQWHNKRGWGRGSTAWVVLTCNAPGSEGCTALALVSEDSILVAVDQALLPVEVKPRAD